MARENENCSISYEPKLILLDKVQTFKQWFGLKMDLQSHCNTLYLKQILMSVKFGK